MSALMNNIAFQITNTRPSFTGDDFYKLLPEIIVLVTGIVLMIVDLILPRGRDYNRRRLIMVGVAIIGFVASIVASAVLFNYKAPAGVEISSFSGMFVRDNFTTFLELIFAATAILTVLISPGYMLKQDIPLGDYYSVITFATLGMMITGSAGDLMVVFVGIELSSISVYILTGFARNDRGSAEGALKYFLLGILATAILVYGMAWLFGMTGSTNLNQINASIVANKLTQDTGLTFAMLLLIVGFGFKIAAVPFHLWTPDAYEGAPTPVAAFMSVGPKAAGFAAMIRVLVQGMPALSDQWSVIIAILAILTMTLGNIVAIAQRSVKRMLAYSSIAHTGYIMVGLAAFSSTAGTERQREAIGAVLIYSAIYVFMNIGAFAVIAWIQNKGGGPNLEDFNGLATWSPGAALLMAIFLFSLTGLPPTGGFLGKFFVFRAAIDNGYTWLAIVGVLNSAVSAFFYLNVIVSMYFRPPPAGVERVRRGGSALLFSALIIITIAIIFFGIYPGPALDMAKDGASPLFEVTKALLNR